MKKIIIVLLVLTSVFLFAACGMLADKDALSADGFTDIMSDNSFEVDDVTSNYIHLTDIVASYIVASKDGLVVEFAVFRTGQQAVAAFNENRQDFVNARSGGTYSEVNAANHNRYRQTSAGMFSFVGRIDNTLVFINTPEENRSAANDIIDILGY